MPAPTASERSLYVSALLAGLVSIGCGDASDWEDVSSTSQAVCTGSKLSALEAPPVAPGTAVSLTATPATCATGETPEYRFAYNRLGTKPYVEIQGWSTSLTATWDTTGLPGGQYNIVVYSRAAGGPASHDAIAYLGYFIDDVCTSATLDAAPASPQNPGTAVTLTAAATCNGTATPEFRFLYRAPTGGAWIPISDYGPSPVAWNTTGLSGGTYNLLVQARAVGNTSSVEASQYGLYTLGGLCSSASLTTTPPSPQLAGTTVGLSASATCTAGLTAEFRFYYQVPGNGAWNLLQDWNGGSATWDTTSLPTGTHTLRVDVRPAEHGGAHTATAYEKYLLQGSGYSQIATGVGWHTCAVANGGTGRCWGLNDFGQLGNGSTSDSSTPVQVSGLSNVVAISPGGYHTCALVSGGTVACWGAHTDGQLGDGSSSPNPVTSPVAVTGLSDVSAISMGTYHSCALKSDGTVWCWGDNEFGQVGNGTFTGNVHTPTQVVGITGATAISAGGWHTCALVGGSVLCWGLNDLGQLGGGFTSSSETTPVTALTGASAVAAGDSHTCALKLGKPWCWGFNAYGQLGNGSTTDSPSPVGVSLASITHISAGYAHTCGRRYPDGSLYCWGNNDFGALGDGSLTSSSTPVTVSGVSGAMSVGASGGLSSCALLAGGNAVCWGDNLYGQLGDGTNTASSTPVSVLGP